MIRACWFCRIFPLLGAYSSVLLNEAPSRCDDDWEFEMEMRIKQIQASFKYDRISNMIIWYKCFCVHCVIDWQKSANLITLSLSNLQLLTFDFRISTSTLLCIDDWLWHTIAEFEFTLLVLVSPSFDDVHWLRDKTTVFIIEPQQMFGLKHSETPNIKHQKIAICKFSKLHFHFIAWKSLCSAPNSHRSSI